jgi:hypothetical protein
LLNHLTIPVFIGTPPRVDLVFGGNRSVVFQRRCPDPAEAPQWASIVI